MLIHLWRLLRLRLLRFRLETFGLYFPSLPHARPWWRVTPHVVPLFARRLLPYTRWAADVRYIGQRGAAGWWERHLRPAERARWERALSDLDR